MLTISLHEQGATISSPLTVSMADQADQLLIDAKNVLFRTIYGARKENAYTVRYHYFALFLRRITEWMNIYRPNSVHVFWDAPRKSVWRKKILSEYKNRPDSNLDDIREELDSTITIAKDFFNVMNVRQYSRKAMEADDLLYAAITTLHPSKSVIISTDSDMAQIPFYFNSCTVYNQATKKELEVPSINPAVQKALVGDTTDRVPGYLGIGPKKSEAMLKDLSKLSEFLTVYGSKTFHRNLLLIDLSVCPYLLHNKIYVQNILTKPLKYDDKEINALVLTHKVNGILQDYDSLIKPFSRLV